MRIEWTKALATGHPDIDAQHEELFARADRLVAGVGARNGELTALVDHLHAYAVEHFGLEEEFMRDRAFAGYHRHKAQHDRFIRDLLAFAHELGEDPGNVLLAARVGEWLARWLSEHVASTDAELAALVGNGAHARGA